MMPLPVLPVGGSFTLGILTLLHLIQGFKGIILIDKEENIHIYLLEYDGSEKDPRCYNQCSKTEVPKHCKLPAAILMIRLLVDSVATSLFEMEIVQIIFSVSFLFSVCRSTVAYSAFAGTQRDLVAPH